MSLGFSRPRGRRQVALGKKINAFKCLWPFRECTPVWLNFLNGLIAPKMIQRVFFTVTALSLCVLSSTGNVIRIARDQVSTKEHSPKNTVSGDINKEIETHNKEAILTLRRTAL